MFNPFQRLLQNSPVGQLMTSTPNPLASLVGLEGNPMQPMPEAPQGVQVASNGRDMTPYRDAIAAIESAGSGDYVATGPQTSSGDRAYGRYQIMGNNIGPWSSEALGRPVSKEEFMRDPAIQDAVFDHQFGKYVDQFGEEGAAQAWFGGPGSVGKGDRQDMLGTSVSSYGRKFVAGIGKDGSPDVRDAPTSRAPLDRIFGRLPSKPGTPAPKQPSAMERVLSRAGSRGVQPVQTPEGEAQPVQARGGEAIAQVTQKLVEQRHAPDQRAAARREALRKRVRNET